MPLIEEAFIVKIGILGGPEGSGISEIRLTPGMSTEQVRGLLSSAMRSAVAQASHDFQSQLFPYLVEKYSKLYPDADWPKF